jgi:predicted transcriptional regulator
MKKNYTHLLDNDARKASDVLSSFYSQQRLDIINTIIEKHPINQDAIVWHLKITQSIIAAHMKDLTDHRLVNETKKGRSVFYTPNHKNIKLVNKAIDKIISISR